MALRNHIEQFKNFALFEAVIPDITRNDTNPFEAGLIRVKANN